MLHENVWTTWPDACLNIPYKTTQQGIGNGEERLAALMSGTVSGHSLSYDIKDANGKLWEVKEPTPMGVIRTGAKGTEVVSVILSKLATVADCLISGVSFIEKHDLLLEDIIDPQGAFSVKTFINNDIALIKRGEIPTSRLWRFITVMQAIRASASVKKEKAYITLSSSKGEKRLLVTESELIRISKILNVNVDFSSNDNEKKTDLLSVFDDAAFDDPLTFAYDVWHAPASKTFLGVEGVILVDHIRGYFVIPKADLDKKLKFYAISQSAPRYKVNIE